MAGKFEIKATKDGEFVFNLKAANGEIILNSESYKAKASAMNGIESVRKNSQIDEHFKHETAKNGQFFFVLKAGNNEPIGKSELYTAEAGMLNGIASVKKNAPDAKVEDLTEKK